VTPDEMLAIANVGVALLMIALSLPLIYEKVPPNGWYGFHTPKTMSSDSMWYRANKLGGRYFVAAALVQLVAALLLSGIWPEAVTQIMPWGILPAVPILAAVLLWYLKIGKW
jgi:uncharacterized membrane protein